MTRLQKLASGLLTGLAMSGCAGSETLGPETSRPLADLPRVTASPRDTCQTQREIAAQNSYVDTIRDGTEKVYKPACELTPGAKPKAAKSPALSSVPGGRLPAGQSPGTKYRDAEREFHEAMDAELREQKRPAPAVDADRAKRTGALIPPGGRLPAGAGAKSAPEAPDDRQSPGATV